MSAPECAVAQPVQLHSIKKVGSRNCSAQSAATHGVRTMHPDHAYCWAHFKPLSAGPRQSSPEMATSAPSKRQQWQPSDRVLALTDEQQQETRERLNIVADDSAGKCVSPIESFDEMVGHVHISSVAPGLRRPVAGGMRVFECGRLNQCLPHAAAQAGEGTVPLSSRRLIAKESLTRQPISQIRMPFAGTWACVSMTDCETWPCCLAVTLIS